MTPRELLDGWLSRRLDRAATEWLRAACERVSGSDAGPDFFLAYGTATRKAGRADLALADADVRAANEARRGWSPVLWSVDQAVRARLLLALPDTGAESLARTAANLCADGDLGEQVAFFQALPLLPHPETFRARTAEGIRTNMKPVFEAIAHRNPYPAEQLDEAAWNQLVVKCFFVGSPLFLIDGLDGRTNTALARILCDLARERWAAGRPVSPELWRCVGPVADGPMLADLTHAVAIGTDVDRAAVGLSTQHNPNAEGLLFAKGRVINAALGQYPTWDAILAALPR